MAESYSLEAILSARDTNFTSTMESAQRAMGNMGKASSGFGNTMKGVISGLGVFKIASAAVGAVTGSIDNAISRVDTLANSARVFENMGYSASDTESMMESLNDSITGLPTSLNDAVSGVQLLASAMGDIGKSQEVFSAMNNAILGFGGTAGMVDNAIVQLSQAFSNGKIDAQTWNSMINSGLGPALNALAKEMGYTTGEFKAYLSDGTISVEEFQDALISLDKDGGGGLKSLQQIAQDSTKGISTSLANARTSITRGVANIITAIDTGLANAGLGSISDIITGIGKAAEKMLTGLAGGIETLGYFIAPLVEGFKSMMGPIEVATGALGAFQSATDELTGSVADVASIFEEWDSLTLEEKQATVSTMGQEEMEELLNLLGVDFDTIPDEYTKEAYLNAYGKDALEELLWVTGKWHDLTFEEKRAVLEAQIENDEIKEAIDSMELWGNTEFYSKLADINMNDNDAEQQVLDLINSYREVEGLEPLNIEVEADGVEEIIANVSEEMTNLGKTIGKTAKLIRRGIKAMMKFFQPLKDIGKDVLRASIKAFEGYFEAFDKLVDGEWGEAWELFKETSVDFLGDVVSSLKTNVPKIWDNVKNLASKMWNAFTNIDWGQVYEDIGSFLDGIGEQVAKIDWQLVAGEVGGAISDFVAKSTAWLTENMPKALKFVQNVLLNPRSKLNKDAGAFKAEIDGIIDAFLAGLGVPETIINWSFKINLWPEIIWDKLVEFWNGLENLTSHEGYDQEVTMTIASLRMNSSLTDSDIQQHIDAEFGEGTYETHIDMEADLNLIMQENQEGEALIESLLEPLRNFTQEERDPVEVVQPFYFKPVEVAGKDFNPSSGIGASASGSVTSTVEPPQIDFSGMIADAQSAMQQVNQTITAGMSNMASAVRIGTSMMNMAFRSGMNQAIVTAQNTVNRVVSVFSNLSSRLHSAGMMAGAGFRNGLASQQASIVSTAQSIANSVSNTIQSALRIASPSKVTTYLGEMVGAGLIAGMDGMVAGVESSANRLSLATLPTTDLGSSHYGGSISGQSTSSKLDEVIDAINRGQVIMLDSGTLVGETSRQMDVALGQQGSLGGRHKL